MTKDEANILITRGLEAQHFLQFIEREPYFKAVFQEMDDEYVKDILGLDPQSKEKFALIQTKRHALYEPLNRIRQDVEIGKRAETETPQGEGIL